MLINNILKSGLLEKAIDASVLKSEAISQNISNVDTPNYKRKDVKFEEILRETLDTGGVKGVRTDPRHIPIGEADFSNINPKVTEDASRNNMRLDGNNVDINTEMAQLAKNTIKYNALVKKLGGQYKKLISVISEGRK